MIKLENNTKISNALKKFDADNFSRQLFSMLGYEGDLDDQTINGFTKEQISNMAATPEKYQSQLVDLSNYMYRSSGYYKGVANYYINMALYRWTVDTEVLNADFYKTNPEEIKQKYFEIIGNISKLNLQSEISKIFKKIFLEDCCYGYMVETDINTFVYYLPSNKCAIKKQYDGIYGFGIKASSYSEKQLLALPKELQTLIKSAKTKNETWAIVPPDKSVCIKYNENFTYVFPPLFTLLASISDINDYKALAKRKSENENYNLLSFEIPTDPNDDDHLLLTDPTVLPFIQIARNIAPKGFGILPTPMKVTPIQFKSNNAERDKVRDAITQFYGEAAVPEAMMGSSTSGSELKQAIQNDSSEIYRIYRQIEQMINLKMMILGYAFATYRLKFQMLDITIYNKDDFIAAELKDAQASIPNKSRLCAAKGITPDKMFGNAYLENTILELGSDWTVLQSSHTTTTNTSDNNNVGAPSKKDGDKSIITEVGDSNDSNNPDNRV